MHTRMARIFTDSQNTIYFFSSQEMALHVLLNVTGSTECIDDIAANHVLVNVLHVLYTLPQHRTVALDLLHAISGDTRLVKECLQFGKLHYAPETFKM